MSSIIKNILGVTLVLALGALAYAGFSLFGAYSRSVQLSTGLVVSGQGRALAVPDIANFTVGVITEGGKDLPGLQRENTERAGRIIAFLKSEGVGPEDIKTAGYRVEPRYRRYECGPGREGAGRPCPPPEIVGYSVTLTVSVKVRDLKSIGVLLEGAVSRGANTVSSLSFSVDDPGALRDRALEDAVKNAQEAARAMATAGGFRLGRLLSLQETSTPAPFYEARTLAAREAAPQVEPGTEEVTAEVTLMYEIP
jgi:uncharacterized protein YggE